LGYLSSFSLCKDKLLTRIPQEFGLILEFPSYSYLFATKSQFLYELEQIYHVIRRKFPHK